MSLLVVLLGLLALPLALALAAGLAVRYGAWRLSRALGRAAPYLLGPRYGGGLAFLGEGLGLREAGKIEEAVALARARVSQDGVATWSRNVAIDILISGGAYAAALGAEPSPSRPGSDQDASALAVIQINLAEAEYNVGRWEAAEARLRGFELACWRFPMARAGLLQQRAWIAAHRGRAAEALALCASMKARWLPPTYRAEYHYTRAAGLLAAGRLDEAEEAVGQGEAVARRLSSRRNALFLRARVAAARGDWVEAERLCRQAANDVFRGQGGAGLLLWAEALEQLGRRRDAEQALRLVSERDPESEAATEAARRKVGLRACR